MDLLASLTKVAPWWPIETPVLADVALPSGIDMPAKMPAVFLSLRSANADTNSEASQMSGREYERLMMSDRLPSVVPRWRKPTPMLPRLSGSGKLTEMV